jgi:hypothetical protein
LDVKQALANSLPPGKKHLEKKSGTPSDQRLRLHQTVAKAKQRNLKHGLDNKMLTVRPNFPWERPFAITLVEQ